MVKKHVSSRSCALVALWSVWCHLCPLSQKATKSSLVLLGTNSLGNIHRASTHSVQRENTDQKFFLAMLQSTINFPSASQWKNRFKRNNLHDMWEMFEFASCLRRFASACTIFWGSGSRLKNAGKETGCFRFSLHCWVLPLDTQNKEVEQASTSALKQERYLGSGHNYVSAIQSIKCTPFV